VQQVGLSFTSPPSQQSPPSTLWFGEWDPQSLAVCLSSAVPAPPTVVINWVVDIDATNHTTPHSGHISPRPSSLAHPSSIVVGNGSVLPVTSIGDSVLSGPFYLNDVLLAPDRVQNLLSIRRFTTDNSYSMEFDPFCLSLKDLATRHVLAKYDNTGPLYTLPLLTFTTPTCVLSCTPWLPLLPPPPGIVTLATLASMSSPSCRVAQLSPAFEAEMIPCAMLTSLVGTSSCPFLAHLLESFSPLTSFTMTFGPPLF
jgi:hypothetical protein